MRRSLSDSPADRLDVPAPSQKSDSLSVDQVLAKMSDQQSRN